MISSSAVLLKRDYEKMLANEVKHRDFSISFRKDTNDGDCYHTSHSSGVTVIKSKLSLEDKPFILIPQNVQPPAIHKFETELQYEGYVITVNSEERSFFARLVDLTSNTEEEGEFSLDELNGDEYLVMPGAVFTWVVGLQSRGKQVQRVSDIRFRRHAALPIELISKAESKAEELSKFLSVHESHEPISLVID